MLNFMLQANEPNLSTVLTSSENKILYNKLNCCRVGIVESFNPETMEVAVKIANKLVIGINEDGSQNVTDYPLLYAKAYFVGGNDIGITYPLEKGAEGIILFNDRELESWYINGDINPLSYDRCHNITDCIFLAGLHSSPHLVLVKYIENCLNLYYKGTSIQIKSGTINFNTNNLQLNNKSGVTGSFVSKDDKTITVTNGIITKIG